MGLSPRFILALVGAIALSSSCDRGAVDPAQPLRMGYFHGGRNTLLYRAMDMGRYRSEQVEVSFHATRSTGDTTFFALPATIAEYEHIKQAERGSKYFGRTTGPQIIAEMKAGGLDCGMIGESSFLLAVDEGLPWSAIAKLGQDSREAPGKVVVVRAGLILQGPQDFEGLTVGSRESGPYDMVMVREFLQRRGVALERVNIVDMIRQEELRRQLKKQELDLAFLHLHIGSEMVQSGLYEVYPGFTFDFADPALSQSLLVCKDDVIAARADELVLFLAAYKRQVDFELGLSPAERALYSGEKSRGLDLTYFDDLNLPQYSPEPVVDPRLLETMQSLLLEHGVIDGVTPVGPRVDNSLMERALERVATQPAPSAAPLETFASRSPIARLMEVLDHDGDALLSADELTLTAHKRTKFEDYDSDGSGFIDEPELRELVTYESPLLPGYRGKGRHEAEDGDPSVGNNAMRKALGQMIKKRNKTRKKKAKKEAAKAQDTGSARE